MSVARRRRLVGRILIIRYVCLRFILLLFCFDWIFFCGFGLDYVVSLFSNSVSVKANMLTVSEFISSMFIFYVGMVLCMGSIGISFEGLGVFEKHLFSPSFYSASLLG